MSHLIAALISSVLLVTPGQDLPAEFSRLSEEVRREATVIVAGTYAEGRGPCEFLPDGSRRWALLRGFRVKRVYRGEVGSTYVGVGGVEPPKVGSTDEGVERGRDYLLLLRPNPESLEVLRTGKGSLYHGNALGEEEVLAVVELPDGR